MKAGKAWERKLFRSEKLHVPEVHAINCVFASSHMLETICGIWSRDRFSASVENYLFGAKVEWIASNRIESSGSRQCPRKMEFLRGILFYELLTPPTLRIPRAGQRESRFYASRFSNLSIFTAIASDGGTTAGENFRSEDQLDVLPIKSKGK